MLKVSERDFEYFNSAWEEASKIWSSFLKISKPIFCINAEQEKKEGLGENFAMIRLTDQQIVIGLRQILKYDLKNYAVEIFAHEIGHHIYAPGDILDQGRMIARIRKALFGYETHAGFICNLYTDLLINDKLKREFNLKIDSVYEKINQGIEFTKLWTFYMRTYEILWGMKKGYLAKGEISTELETDAQLGNRLIRNFSREIVRGSGRFAYLIYPYLLNDIPKTKQIMKGLLDNEKSESGTSFPSGLVDVDESEFEDNVHPLEDEKIFLDEKEFAKPIFDMPKSPGVQTRTSFEFGEIIKALGFNLSADELKYRYYKEIAIKHLVPFPEKKLPEAKEQLHEGYDTWDIGSPIENIDWIQTAIKSAVVIPGFTTVEAVYGFDVGKEEEKSPIDLDIYIDCSGSMPNPSVYLSYLALAGAIISLSALRVGSKVQATLWSGKKQFITTGGFINDEKEIFRIITGFFGGATQFPLHILRDTYSNIKPSEKKVHILHISDDGITTIFDKDEKGSDGREITKTSLDKAGGFGTMVLNLWSDYKKNKDLLELEKMGYAIHPISDWNSLLDFAKKFSERNYSL